MKRILLLAALLLSVPLLCPAQDQLLPNNSLPFVAALPAACTPGITASVELSVAPFSINYCSAINTWSALTASSGSTWSSLPGGTNTSSAFICGTGCSFATAGAGTITATNGLNSVANDTNVTGSVSGGVLTLAWSGTAAKNRLPATTVYTDQNNTFTLLQDFSGATLRLPTGAGFTSSAGSVLGIDTSNKNPHIFINAQDSYLWTAPVSGVYNNNDCAKFLLSSGQITLVDAGSLCNGLPAGPTSPNGVIANLTSTPASGVSGPAVWTLPGLNERDVIGTTNLDTIQATDCNPMPVFYQGSVSVATTLPTATTLGVSKCTLKLTNNTSGSSTTVTVAPTTWTIVPNTAGNLVIQQGQSCLVMPDATVSTQWDAICADEPLAAGSGITLTRGQYGPTLSLTAGTVTTTGSPASPNLSCFSAPTTITNCANVSAHQFRGNNTGSSAAEIPSLIGANDVSPNVYAAGAGTAQAQTVTLTPAATALTSGLSVCWKPTAANTGAAPTLAVSGLTATAITKLGTTALVANDLTTTAIACAIYDGTQFELQNPQTASAGGSGVGTLFSTAPGGNTVATANPLFFVVNGIGVNAGEGNVISAVGGAGCTAQNLYVVTNNANGTGALTVTLRTGATLGSMSSSTLVATVGSGAAAGTYSDTTHTVALSAGTLVSLNAIMGGAAQTSAQIYGIGFQCK